MAETVHSLKVTVIIEGTVGGDNGASLKVYDKYTQVFGNGTAADQVGNVFQDDSRTLAATSEDLNLDGLTDFQGATIGLNNVKMLYIKNLDSDTGDNITVGGASANQFVNWVGGAADSVVIGPQGILLLLSPVDGYGITASTGDLLKVAANDTSSYKIIYAGDNE